MQFYIYMLLATKNSIHEFKKIVSSLTNNAIDVMHK